MTEARWSSGRPSASQQEDLGSNPGKGKKNFRFLNLNFLINRQSLVKTLYKCKTTATRAPKLGCPQFQFSSVQFSSNMFIFIFFTAHTSR